MMQQSTANPFFSSVSALPSLNSTAFKSDNPIQSTTTPKTATLLPNREYPPHCFPAANLTTLQYYLTPSPKCMAPQSNNNVSSVFQGMPEKHRLLLHKSSKSLGLNQKNQQQQHNIDPNNNNIFSLNQSRLISDVLQSNKDHTAAAAQTRVNHHYLTAQTDQQNNTNNNNNYKRDKLSSSLNPKINSSIGSNDMNFQLNQQECYNIKLNEGPSDQQDKTVPISFERSKSSSQLKIPSHEENLFFTQHCGQENILPNTSSKQQSYFFTLPQDKDQQQQLLSLSQNQDKQYELKESSFRLPLTPIQRLQGKQKLSKNQISSSHLSSGLNNDQQQLLADSILSASSNHPEGFLLSSSSNINPFNPISACTLNLNKLTLETPANSSSNSNNSYVKLNSFLSGCNTNHIRNKSTSDKPTTAAALLKLVSPRGAFNINIGASTAFSEEATTATAMGTLPSTQCLQSPKRQTLSQWAERCHTTESDYYYQQNQKCFLDAKTEESMMEGITGDRMKIGEQLNKTSTGGRSISCSEIIKKQSSENGTTQPLQKQDASAATQQIYFLNQEIDQLKLINTAKQQQECQMQNTNQELKKQIESLSANLLYMENSLKEIEAENASLKKQTEHLQKNEDTAKQEIAQCNDRIRSLEQMNITHQQDLNDFKQSIAHTKKAENDSEINTLSLLLAQSNTKIQQFQEQLIDKEQTARESSDKVIELQEKMVIMSEKAREAAEKAREASSRLVAASEDAQRLRGQVSELERQNSELQSDIQQLASKTSVRGDDKQAQCEHWKKAFDSLTQAVSLFLREFSKRVLSYSKTQKQEQHISSSLVKDIAVFSEGLRELLEEQMRKKDQLAEKTRIIQDQNEFAKELERQIEQFHSQASKQQHHLDLNRNKQQLNSPRNKKDPVDVEEQRDQENIHSQAASQSHKSFLHGQKDQQQEELSQEQQLLNIPKKVAAYIEQEQRLFEQKYRERMADVEQEMFRQMHEKDQRISKLNSENMRLSELNEQRLVEQKILQAHLDRKQEETIRSAKAIEELQKRLETLPGARNNSGQVSGRQPQKLTAAVAADLILKDRRLPIHSIREEVENEHSSDDDEEEQQEDYETLNSKASFEFQEQQQKQRAQDDQSQKYYVQSSQGILHHQGDGMADDNDAAMMEWKAKLDEKRKVISKLRRELEKCKEKLIDMQEREFSQESLNRRLAAELETAKASSQDVPKLIDMLKSRKLEYAELKRRFDTMKQERDQAIKMLNKPQLIGQLNQSVSSLSRHKNRNIGSVNSNNHSLVIQQNLDDTLSSAANRFSEPAESTSHTNQKHIIQQQQQQRKYQQQQCYRAHSLSAERNQNLNNLFQTD